MLVSYSIYDQKSREDFYSVIDLDKEVPKDSVLLAVVIEDNEGYLGMVEAEDFKEKFGAHGIVSVKKKGYTYHLVYSYEAEIRIWVKLYFLKIKKMIIRLSR